MTRKVIIDCDPGTGDAVALCIALFHPQLEVVAVTAAAGNVPADQASRNVQAIVDQLDPPRFPRIGAAVELEKSPDAEMFDYTYAMNGSDGLAGAGFAVSELHQQHSSPKVIHDAIRTAPGEVTILAFGPLTNLAAAFHRDPLLAEMVDRVIIMGGSVAGIGDVTRVAQQNIFYDPAAAQAVFDSPTTKTLVPLDVTRQVSFTLELINALPAEETRAGAFLHRIVPFMFRAFRQHRGIESIRLDDCVALLAALQPELFETVEMSADVETTGRLTSGMTVFDRRPNAQSRGDMEVATSIDRDAAFDFIMQGIRNAGAQSK